MNRNPKEKYARIEVRVKPKDKEKIKQIADKCGLSVSEYVTHRKLCSLMSFLLSITNYANS